MQIAVNKTTGVLLLTILIITAASNAQAVAILGSRSCGTWINQRTTGRAGATEAWLIGFLSGMAFQSNKDIIKGTDNDSIYLWIDNYCRANPLKALIDASDNLFDELMKQKRL